MGCSVGMQVIWMRQVFALSTVARYKKYFRKETYQEGLSIVVRCSQNSMLAPMSNVQLLKVPASPCYSEGTLEKK